SPRTQAPGLRFRPAVVAIEGCAINCYEPSVAADARGHIFVATGDEDVLAVSSDGGRHFTSVPLPPLLGTLPSFGAGHGDGIVQVDPSGRLVYSALTLSGIQ